MKPLVIAFGLMACGHGDSGDDPRIAMLQAIAGGYDENRAKFSHGAVRFFHEIGFADNADAARKGELRNKATAQGLYVFVNEGDHRRFKYCREYPESEYKTHSSMISDTQTSTVLESLRLVSDGSLTLHDRISWNPPVALQHSSEIHPGVDRFFLETKFPYDLGFPEDQRTDMGVSVRDTLKVRGEAAIVTVEDDVEFEGRSHLLRFRLRFKNGVANFVVDPVHGWTLLYQHDDVDKGWTFDYYYDDIRLVPGGGWLPFTKTQLTGTLVTRIVLVEADFERVPDASEFSLEYPEPRGAYDTARGLLYQEKRKVWDLQNLPSANSANVKKLTLRVPSPSPARTPDLPGEREATPWFLSPVTLVIALVSLVGAFAYVRLRRR